MAQPKAQAAAASQEAAAVSGKPAWPIHWRLSAVVVGLALASLAGWAADIPLLTTLAPGRPAMSPMTAVLLLVGCVAMAVLPTRQRTALILGLLEVFAGLTIVVTHESAGVVGPALWWSSQLTGIAFAISGLATVLLACGRLVAGELTAFAVLLYASLLGIGHLFPRADLYRNLPGTGVAIPTVFSFISLSIGLLVAVEGHSFSRALSRGSAIGLLAIKLLMGSVAATLVLAVPAVHAIRRDFFDAETAVLLVAWGAMVLLGGTIWGLAVAVHRAQTSAAAAEQRRDDVRRMVIAAVTHDLRNPLQTAVLSAAVLARLSHEPRAAAAVAKVQRSHRRIDRLLRSLLDGLSMEAGRTLQLQLADVRLDALVQEVVADNDSTLAGRVVLRGAAEGRWDRDALFRVIENLLLNAVKYGAPDSQIHCEIQDSKSGARLMVTNQGPPIPLAEWETIFQPFTRGSMQGMDAAGWGVGLAYARSVATSHGGRLRLLESGVGGTQFELWLPNSSARSPTG